MQSSISFRYASNTYSFLYRLFDLGAIWFALKIACFIHGYPLGGDYIIAGLVVSVAYLNLSEFIDLYRSWRVGRFSTMVINAWFAVIFSFLVFLLVAFLFKQSSDYSRVILAIWFSLVMFFVFAWRKVDRGLKKDLRRRGIGVKKIAIIGATKSGFDLFLQVQQNAELGYEFEGFYEDRRGNRLLGLVGVQVEGSIDDAIERARKGEIQT
ncbi:MAG: undecaprenyl-phosphate glucose phosphotransferase, partial [Gammaproteobacteria bacterium]|nr:undecaprenyl-phosphate glucose phosphotransferase [Gammaproteobacteria bacterium]